ncbi:MAG: hypothetical protein P4M08_09870 [Oligoflexia bacterium]|nr:hypothetical protein [Oligoflexia bacterium]
MSNSNNQPPGNKKEGTNPVFTIDSDQAQHVTMPGITKLLNRKKLELAESRAKATNSVKTPSTQEPQRQPPPPPKSVPKIQPVARRGNTRNLTSSSMSRMRLWKGAELAESPEALLKGVHTLSLKSSVRALLFSGSPLRATAAYEPGELLSLWEGLTFNGEFFFDLWTEILNTGILNLGQGKPTETGSRRLFRNSLGLKPEDWLLVIRSGSGGTGKLLILISDQELSAKNGIANAFPFLAPKARAA